jgi:hypothetical protein
MKSSSIVLVVLIGAAGVLANAQRGGVVNPHAYFESMAARPNVIAAFSMRSQAEMEAYKAAKSRPPAAIYLYPNDPYHRPQDGAKVEIPPFTENTTLTAGMSAGATALDVAAASGVFVRNRHLEIGKEIMKIVSRSGNRVTVERAQFGTAATSHPAGSPVGISGNSLANQVWLPITTLDGNSYLVTWDAWFGKELRRAESGLINWKTFQFDAPRRPGGRPTIWFEVRTRFDLAPTPGDVAMVDARSYSTPHGPNVTDLQPLEPAVGTFVVRPETWLRYWVLIEQKASDWDLMSLWVADEHTDPVQLINRLQFEAHDGIRRFRFEYNTSQDPLGAKRGPLVSYFRNFVMLQGVSNVPALMQRPVTGPASSGLAAPPPTPKNLRVIG